MSRPLGQQHGEDSSSTSEGKSNTNGNCTNNINGNSNEHDIKGELDLLREIGEACILAHEEWRVARDTAGNDEAGSENSTTPDNRQGKRYLKCLEKMRQGTMQALSKIECACGASKMLTVEQTKAASSVLNAWLYFDHIKADLYICEKLMKCVVAFSDVVRRSSEPSQEFKDGVDEWALTTFSCLLRCGLQGTDDELIQMLLSKHVIQEEEYLEAVCVAANRAATFGLKRLHNYTSSGLLDATLAELLKPLPDDDVAIRDTGGVFTLKPHPYMVGIADIREELASLYS